MVCWARVFSPREGHDGACGWSIVVFFCLFRVLAFMMALQVATDFEADVIT